MSDTQSQRVQEPAALFQAGILRDGEDQCLARQRANKEAILQFLQSLRDCSEVEAEEQKLTFEFLKQALGTDRPSNRKLF